MRTVTPLVQAQRNRGKINIQRPKKPHFLRQLEMDLTIPILPKREIDPIEKCITEKTKKKTITSLENPYLRIIANDCRNWFDQSKLIAIFHVNPISGEDMFKLQVPLYKSNMHVKRWGKRTLEMAFENTGYKALMPLFQSQTLIVFSPEVQVGKLLKIVRKTPQIVFLAGVVEGRLLHKDDFINYSKLPDIQVARASFAQLLLSSGSQITSQLNQHQNILVRHLESRAEQLRDSVDKKE